MYKSKKIFYFYQSFESFAFDVIHLSWQEKRCACAQFPIAFMNDAHENQFFKEDLLIKKEKNTSIVNMRFELFKNNQYLRKTGLL